jgi:hypothetical protein
MLRGRFTVKLMQPTLQAASLAQAPSKALGRTLAMSWKCSKILQLICERNLIEVFLELTRILKIYIMFLLTSCKAEISFSKLSITKNKF